MTCFIDFNKKVIIFAAAVKTRGKDHDVLQEKPF